MAANYQFTMVRETSELLGGQTTQKVNEFGVLTKPSGIYFQFRRTPALSTPANLASVADQLAVRFEAVLAEPDVTALSYSQDTSDAGQLVDIITIYWQDPANTVRGSIQQNMASVGPNVTPPLVQAAIAAALALLNA